MSVPRRIGSAAPVRSLPEDTGLEVVVIFTTVKRTVAALRTAAKLAHGLASHIRLIVPHVVPFPVQLDQPPVQREFSDRKFRTLAEESPIDTYVDIRLCRDWEAGALWGLKPHAIAVMGAGRHWWPLSRERRLARALRKCGHQVLLAS